MRIHIDLDPDLVAEVDAKAGRRGRSKFIRTAVRSALDQEARWEALVSAMGSISDRGHEWDSDPAAWVRKQRRVDKRRVG
jgi:hypothetical protein